MLVTFFYSNSAVGICESYSTQSTILILVAKLGRLFNPFITDKKKVKSVPVWVGLTQK